VGESHGQLSHTGANREASVAIIFRLPFLAGSLNYWPYDYGATSKANGRENL
jgi:hypothetical protein